MKSLKERLTEKGYKLELSPAALDKIADAGFDPVYGARPLKRAIQVEIENPLAQKLLSGDLSKDGTIKIDLNGDVLTIQ
jgi:ATP-dependent Clp protease ATP-binding subunit ClpB